MEEFYNKHYIRIREDGCIVDGFSDSFREPTDDAMCINEQGGYQFRLFPDGEENPCLMDWQDMIPLYKWNGEVLRRKDEEIEAERASYIVSKTPAQKREEAYNTDPIIDWDGERLTVTQASQKWQYYAAEGSAKADELQALIAAAKAEIREKYPD